jgi:response regulator RpfG family c-di-GMP phosphodiesterase
MQSQPEERGVIICVDDESMILTSLREQLRQLTDMGFSIEVSTDGEDALELLKDLINEGEEVPLFISDQIMPGLKGNEVLREVHRLSPHTKTILLTGQADLEAVQKAVNEANLYRYMSKPWEQADLLLTARAAVESYLSEQQIRQQRKLLEQTNEVFKCFVPEPFLRRIASNGLSSIQVGYNELTDLTVLFSDIRGFIMIAESMLFVELLTMFNSYFTALSAPIH